MTFGERLIVFIKKCYGTQAIFADKIGLDKTSINRYVRNKITPTYEILTKFSEAGLSIDWLMTGAGSMYSSYYDNNFGQSIIGKEKAPKNGTIERIKDWISNNYDSIEHFALAADLKLEDVNKLINGIYIPDDHIFDGLVKAGCNLNWIILGKGNQYEENNTGLQLLIDNEGIELSDIDESSIDSRFLKGFYDKPIEVLLSLIKKMIKIELNERLK